MHRRLTVILRPTSYKNHRWAAMKVVCKLNDCILGRKYEATHADTSVAKGVSRLTLLNCSVATCFAAEVHSNLQLLEVR